MKLKFKEQQYQLDAVQAVVDVFKGQPNNKQNVFVSPDEAILDAPFRNAEIALDKMALLQNIKEIQKQNSLPISEKLAQSEAAPGAPNLDIEMETGTGKTYVYIRTIMELNKQYGWSKFIIVVPSVAIREGVKKTFEVTAEHFQEIYGTSPRAFIYNSSRLNEVRAFCETGDIQVMIINVQAFNSISPDNRRIYEAQDSFGSAKPIDLIKANRPIVIVDEPQKIGTEKSLESLAEFNALMMLRYSATHKVKHDQVYRLDSIDAINQKLVKKISVTGIEVTGINGLDGYLYVDFVEASKEAPYAKIELEVQTKTGIKRQSKTVRKGAKLHELSGGIEAYAGLQIIDINALEQHIELSNGAIIPVGTPVGSDSLEENKRRIQIREVIDAHFQKEQALFVRGIKELSLFFIDEVVKYRDYDAPENKGEYARIFEKIYTEKLNEVLASDIPAEYRAYLERDTAKKVHEGYFSVDKQGKSVDGSVSKKRGGDKGLSVDTDAYDLILRNKERLLSLDEPVRFIFSHSALREGWDNPNVFVMGMLKKSDSAISKRQEIGRGLRLCVNQNGERMDDEGTVDINQLTVVTDESYTSFVNALQTEIAEATAGRPKKLTKEYLTGKSIIVDDIKHQIDDTIANLLCRHFVKNDYTNDDDTISDIYIQDKNDSRLSPLDVDMFGSDTGITIEILDEQIIAPLYGSFAAPIDNRKTKKNTLVKSNFEKKEFQELWKRINHKVIYQVSFDSAELVGKATAEIDKWLNVSGLQVVITRGTQKDKLDANNVADKTGFVTNNPSIETAENISEINTKYDLIGEITEKTGLLRKTAAEILASISADKFALFHKNPEDFIVQCARIINEQKATMMIKNLAYNELSETFDTSIFTVNETVDNNADLEELEKHIYKYAVTDSNIERDFRRDLEGSPDVIVYAKLPRGFHIPTPVGNYNPDWAIAFKEDNVKHIYFIAETKGDITSTHLRQIEEDKIGCARKLFEKICDSNNDSVKYDVVENYSKLLNIVRK